LEPENLPAGKYLLNASYSGFRDVSIEVKIEAQDVQPIRAEASPLFIRLKT
jgi:hypothetical protein